MSIFILVIYLLLIYLFGYLVVKMIDSNSNLVEAIGLSFLIGLGLITYLLFVTTIIGIAFTALNLFLVLILANLLLIFIINCFSIGDKTYWLNFSKLTGSADRTRLFLIALLFTLFLGSLVTNLYWPVKDWDSLTLYDSRARILVDKGFLQDMPLYYFSYPLLTSVAHAIVYVFDINNPMFLYSLFFGSFLLVFYELSKKISGPSLALFLTFFVAISPQIFDHSMMAYTNLPYTIYFSLSALYLYYWMRDKKTSNLVLFTLLISISTWIRSTEPYWIVLLGLSLFFTVGVFFVREGNRKYTRTVKNILLPNMISLIAVYFFVWIWRAYSNLQIAKLSVNDPGQLTYFKVFFSRIYDIDFIMRVLDYIIRFTIEPVWQLYVIYILGLLYCITKRKNLIYSLVLTTLICSMIAGIFLFAGGYSGWEEIHGSLLRMSMVFYPLLIFYIACIFEKEKEHR